MQTIIDFPGKLAKWQQVKWSMIHKHKQRHILSLNLQAHTCWRCRWSYWDFLVKWRSGGVWSGVDLWGEEMRRAVWRWVEWREEDRRGDEEWNGEERSGVEWWGEERRGEDLRRVQAGLAVQLTYIQDLLNANDGALLLCSGTGYKAHSTYWSGLEAWCRVQTKKDNAGYVRHTRNA